MQILNDSGLVAFSVAEVQQGNTDLNGDGDSYDSVVHVYDTATGTISNLKLAGWPIRNDSGLVAFIVAEVQQGNTDLNGDGDSDDEVVHVYDTATGAINNLKLAGAGWHIRNDSGLVAFSVAEVQQGNTDLNGDGDSDDEVVHVYDTATGTINNLKLATDWEISNDSGLVAFYVHEFGQGNTDLNGDGDSDDPVVHVYDAATGIISNLKLAGWEISNDSGLVAFYVHEFRQGNTDLNGDDDSYDSVVHVFDAATGTISNLKLAGWPIRNDSGLVAFSVNESGQGNTDLNGDGDSRDEVVHVYDTATGTINNLKLAGMYLHNDSGLVAFSVNESGQGNTDLNGDGDSYDSVVHVFDAATGTINNLKLAGGIADVDSGLVAFLVNESGQGNTDLNGDGDSRDDGIIHIWTLPADTIEVEIDIKPGTDPNSINLGSAGVIPVAILSSETFDALEVDPGTVSLAGARIKMVGKSGKYLSHEEDINGDGLLDLVCQVYTAQFMVESGETIAILEAETFDGEQVRGEETINIVPDN
jgi:hypothetical protein